MEDDAMMDYGGVIRLWVDDASVIMSLKFYRLAGPPSSHFLSSSLLFLVACWAARPRRRPRPRSASKPE